MVVGDVMDYDKLIDVLRNMVQSANGLNIQAADAIEALQAQIPKQGVWIEREDMYYGWNIWECSACHEEFCIEEGTPKDNEYKYCPNCGAKMEVSE